ncbi:methyltransferase domain-containing protein [Aquibium sp. A9E412]|uniref:class I SAM-dependent methyltransferase n=1 Tax=Aquibium sp. A9E412 TaxID=2976767 RepID=UPI0025B0C3B8|nr:methyltransferase domain-containing protein [Aquibium sp. A9E412]MDN2566578.1 methyltransferase domain-containing protein [Aquibium sp. A9E412]
MSETPNAAQAEFWNAQPGRNWVAHQDDLDALHAAVTELLLEAAAPRPGESVLDVGCGAGASSFAVAEAVGPNGRVHGIDISAPLLARAEARQAAGAAGDVAFTLADAQVHPFEAGGYDLVVSRFGLMFFADPPAAFANIRKGLRAGGRIVFVAWAGPQHNPWFAAPQAHAEARLGPAAPSAPEAPGPMAFRDAERVCAILAAAGFAAPQGRAVDIALHHPGGLEAVMGIVPHVGPIARMLREKDGTQDDRAAILAAIAEDFARYRTPDGIRIPARVHLFTAGNP